MFEWFSFYTNLTKDINGEIIGPAGNFTVLKFNDHKHVVFFLSPYLQFEKHVFPPKKMLVPYYHPFLM